MSIEKHNENNISTNSIDLDADFSYTTKNDTTSLNSSSSRINLGMLKAAQSNAALSCYSSSTPVLNKDLSEEKLEQEKQSNLNSQNSGSSNPLNEKVASLASSIYTELEKIVKLHGRDTVKDMMSILVNILGE